MYISIFTYKTYKSSKKYHNLSPSSEWRRSRSGTFLAPSTDKESDNYDTESSTHYPSQLPYDTGVEP